MESVAIGLSIVFLLIFAVIAGVGLAGLWKIFIKAGYKGWPALVPPYNLYILCKMTGRPGWWVFLMFVPIVNIPVLLVIALDLGNAFGRSGLYSMCALWLLPAVGFTMLGFGNATYTSVPPLAIPKLPQIPPVFK